jgi:hypothetical protein
MQGEGEVAGSQPMSTAVHIGAQINFGDLNPYFTYAYRAPIGSLLFQNSYWLPSGGVTCLMNPVYTVAETKHALELTKPKVQIVCITE